ncbi:hypothetical protein A2645_00225 [Candidatus Nomurabacteria bacterium RIFCSPHIGHO2_01_FULL_39_9]|uniref:CMP/dCMP-type deaminase domain-containing protein n=1 Tax=Candidatus Nomurabacteria bacterium RIFCSPHIGHO2_01_FULL_39_9 TaxID=1801735 RepID=A0A1F6UXY9_9BACT|nr:MAG: hypothetical protein A2645_00225 [Candidatus Nomurabacteria bacterium RIFCSPHIGHO2_01_FULL_39_9]
MKNGAVPLAWKAQVDSSVLAGMLPHKINLDYTRPTFLDVLAQEAIVISKRATCLWNEVGAIIFHRRGNNGVTLASGYNGPSAGDVDPRIAGCARIVDGVLHEGAGRCRGSHAELNAIGNLTTSTIGFDNLGIMVTLRPCYGCAKQIVNKGIKEVYYIWEYGLDPQSASYLKSLGVRLEKYNSKFLADWIKINNYEPPIISKSKPR